MAQSISSGLSSLTGAISSRVSSRSFWQPQCIIHMVLSMSPEQTPEQGLNFSNSRNRHKVLLLAHAFVGMLCDCGIIIIPHHLPEFRMTFCHGMTYCIFMLSAACIDRSSLGCCCCARYRNMELCAALQASCCISGCRVHQLCHASALD